MYERMADKEKKDAVETTSRPQIRRSRKKTDTDAGTDQAQMTTTDALEGEAETRTIRRRRTTVAGEKTTKTTSARSTRKKTDEGEAAQDRQYHLLPDALAQAEAPASFQFMRLGYFCADSRDSAPGHLVFNRAVGLKDSFKPQGK